MKTFPYAFLESKSFSCIHVRQKSLMFFFMTKSHCAFTNDHPTTTTRSYILSSVNSARTPPYIIIHQSTRFESNRIAVFSQPGQKPNIYQSSSQISIRTLNASGISQPTLKSTGLCLHMELIHISCAVTDDRSRIRLYPLNHYSQG